MSLWSKIKRFLLLILVIVLFIFVMLMIFPTKKSLDPLYQDVFRNNINSMKDAADKYFTNERMPKNVGDKVKITLREMLDKKLLLPFVDKNGNQCDLDKSYVQITKKDTEYEMKVNLLCTDQEAYIIEILGCTDRCLDCKKEEKEETKETTKTDKKPGKTPDPTPTVNPPKDDPKETWYQLKKTETRKEINGYMCPEGYTLNGKKCSKVETSVSTLSATPVYSTREVSTDAKATTKEVETYEYLYSKEIISYTEVEDTSKPLFQKTYDNVIGYYTQYVCSGFNYFRDSSTSTTYRTTDWAYNGQVVLNYIPTDTNNTKYIYVGMDYNRCSDSCTLNPYYIYKVYKRSVTAETRTQSQLSVTCNVVEKQIPIYGLKMTFLGYAKNRIENKTTSTKWSSSSNDSTLISQGYKYTGESKVTGTTKETTYSCKAGTLKGDKCVSTERYISNYTCPADYTRSGKTCSKTIYTPVEIDATATYKTVSSVIYKWSKNKHEAGWTFTGVTKTV